MPFKFWKCVAEKNIEVEFVAVFILRMYLTISHIHTLTLNCKDNNFHPVTAQPVSSTALIGRRNVDFQVESILVPNTRLYKNSSGDEIANVNFLRRYRNYLLQNTKKENLLRLTN